jgi:hypothetical protein
MANARHTIITLCSFLPYKVYIVSTDSFILFTLLFVVVVVVGPAAFAVDSNIFLHGLVQ